MTTLEALTQARALIESSWAQGAYADKHCTTGALSYVTREGDPESDDVTFSDSIDVLLKALKELTYTLTTPEYNITDEWMPPWDKIILLQQWNDAPGRNRNEVTALYDRAIELEEA